MTDLDPQAVATALRSLRQWFPMVTVYDHPRDAPEHYVARVWITTGGPLATRYAFRSGDLEAMRAALRRCHLHRLPRQPQDDPAIVETWI